MPKGKLVPRPYKVTVRFGEPMLIKAHPKFRATWQSAADEVRDAVLQLGGFVAASASPTPAEPPAGEEGEG